MAAKKREFCEVLRTHEERNFFLRVYHKIYSSWAEVQLQRKTELEALKNREFSRK